MGPVSPTATDFRQILCVWLHQGGLYPLQAAQIRPQFLRCNGVCLL